MTVIYKNRKSGCSLKIMKKQDVTMDDIIARVVKLSKLEYESFPEDFETKELLERHLLESFNDSFFSDNEASLFGSRTTLKACVKKAIRTFIKCSWRPVAETAVKRTRAGVPVKQNLTPMSKLHTTPPGITTEIDIDIFGNFQLSWGLYSSVGVSSPVVDDNTTFLLKDTQQSEMIRWSINRL